MEKFFNFYSTNIEYSDANNSTSGGLPTYSGFLFLIGSSIFYGSNFIPVKKLDTGDGMFFQLILCLGIWIVGFVVNCIVNFPKMKPLALLGKKVIIYFAFRKLHT